MASRKSRARKEKNRPKSLPVVPKAANEFGRKDDDSSQLGSSSQQRQRATNAVMDSKYPESDAAPIRPKLQKRFYEALVMMEVLGSNRGDRLEEEVFEVEPDPSELGGERLRRSFLRNIAYLCDYETGGDRTTAFALEQTSQGTVYWLASNKGAHAGEDRAKVFVVEILESLKLLRHSKVEEVEKDLFKKAVNFSSKRISYYAKCLKDEIQFVLGDLAKSGSAADNSFLTWLEKMETATEFPSTICQLCYDSRRSSHYAEVRRRTTRGQPCAKRYENVQHLIGRLNHTLKAVKVMIEAGLRLQYLFDAYDIKRAKSPHSSRPPLLERNPTLMAVAGRLLGDQIAIAQCRENLEHLDRLHHLSEVLCQKCKSETWRPRVHAELILLDLFWTQSLEFVENDKYIGCSKPACYCCYHYIIAHPGRFVPPACHNNLWLKWKAPEIYDPKKAHHIKVRENILNEMVQKIRNDVLAQIRERRGPGTRQPDSLTEISTLRQEDFAYLTDDPEGSSGESTYEADFSEKRDLGNMAGDMQFGYQATEEENETEDDEAGGVQLFSALTV